MRLQRLSAWSGFLLLPALIVAFSAGHFLTPMSPTMSPDGIVDFLTKNQHGILLAVVIMVLAVPFEYPFVIVTSLQLRRIEGRWSILSMTQLTTGVVGPIGFFFPLAILSAAAYRPHNHSPDVLSALTDLFWLMLVGNAGIVVLQFWSIGLGALIDRSLERVFPRWFGYFNVLLGILVIPGAFVFLTKTGPFAWNGALAYLIPSIVVFAWRIITPIMLLRAIKSEAAELAETSAAVETSVAQVATA